MEAAILKTIREAEKFLDVQASLHYGANVAVFVFEYEKDKGMYDQGSDFRKLCLAYRASCTPGATERIAEADLLRKNALRLKEQADKLTHDIPWDVARFLSEKGEPK